MLGFLQARAVIGRLSAGGLVDLVEDALVAEVGVLHLLPAAEGADVDEAQLREPLQVLGRHQLRPGRAVVVLGREPLPLLRVEELEVSLGHGARALGVDVRHGRLGEDRDRGNHDVELVAPNSSKARKASFSQAISTSPKPRWAKVVVDARAPVSRTGTLRKIWPTNSRTLASSPL